MLRRLVIAAVVCALALLALRGAWALRESGMLGRCTVAATEPDGTEQARCTAGRLDGLPDLSGKGCTRQTLGGPVEFWSCPAPIASAPAGI